MFYKYKIINVKTYKHYLFGEFKILLIKP